ncbi:hypothetical protein HanRHA438_Chr17g0833601 [Helianthus annuus]|nr:hypothetical protein HanRHA438_Chr17g0833601 [Helianthus annuus]
MDARGSGSSRQDTFVDFEECLDQYLLAVIPDSSQVCDVKRVTNEFKSQVGELEGSMLTSWS